MTRDAEHTPTGYEDAASVVVNQAPAPSSLAGGSLIADLKVLSDCDDMEVSHSHGDTNIGDVARRCLAALSPEAPAREGVSLVLDQAPNFGFETNEPAPRQMIEHYYRSHGMENWQRLADQYCAALTPRHEAPAEKAEYVDAIGALSERTPEAPAEGAGEDAAWMWLNGHVECDPADRDYSADEMVDAFMAGQSAALRARSSAPEADHAEAVEECLDDAAERLFSVRYPGRSWADIRDGAKIGWMRAAWATLAQREVKP